MTEILYLTIRPGRWNKPRIARVSKKEPRISPSATGALVRLHVTLPDTVLIPRIPVATVEIKPEHITPPAVTVTAEPAR